MSLEEAQFWQGIGILVKNYHALNKKIFGVVITDVETLHDSRLCQSSEDELTRCLKEEPNKRSCEGFKLGFKLLPKKLSDNILGTGTVGAKLLLKIHSHI